MRYKMHPKMKKKLKDYATRKLKPRRLKRVVSRRRGSDGLYKSPDDAKIEDGFGSVWSAWCCMCGRKSMHICRPGKVQCDYCG